MTEGHQVTPATVQRSRAMATEVGQVKGAPAGKYDTCVVAQLTRAEQRIRTLDLAAGLLGFVAATLAYAVLTTLVDRRFELSAPARQVAFLVYLLGSGLYLWLLVL